jgi:hypothetical protein
MNQRRTFLQGALASLAVVALPKVITAQTPATTPFARSDDAPPQPEATQAYMRFDRTFMDDLGNYVFGVTLISFESADDAVTWTKLAKETISTPKDNYYLIEELDDVPTYGDYDFTIKGRIDSETQVVQVYYAIGILSYSYLVVVNTVDQGLDYYEELIPKVMERYEEVSLYTDDELYEMLPTERETGFEIMSEDFSIEPPQGL